MRDLIETSAARAKSAVGSAGAMIGDALGAGGRAAKGAVDGVKTALPVVATRAGDVGRAAGEATKSTIRFVEVTAGETAKKADSASKASVAVVKTGFFAVVSRLGQALSMTRRGAVSVVEAPAKAARSTFLWARRAIVVSMVIAVLALSASVLQSVATIVQALKAPETAQPR